MPGSAVVFSTVLTKFGDPAVTVAYEIAVEP